VAAPPGRDARKGEPVILLPEGFGRMNLSQKAPGRPAKFSWDALLKTSLLVFVFLVITKVFNFYKKILIGKLFGVSWVADAFFAASYLPYYLAIFFEGIIYLGFLPHFSRLKEEDEEAARQFAGEILFLLTGVTLCLALTGWFTASWLVGQIVPGFSPAEMELTCQLFRILTGVVVFINMGLFFKSLNSYYYNLQASWIRW
jgi:peptidoglycan biosynthesis protein MviN/MurJ (putative lipid II flippase)